MAELEDLKKDDLLKRYNRILFGAPGTGKSYFLEKNKERAFDKNDNFVERVTFYPRYSYGQFVGMYKPVPADNGVTYKYVPGPFMRTYVKAKKASIANNVYKEYEDDKAKKFDGRQFFFLTTNPDTTWNLFEEIKFESEEVNFGATEEMKKGDIGLIYLSDGNVVKGEADGPGIYAMGKFITDHEKTDVTIKEKNSVKTNRIWLRIDKMYKYDSLIKDANKKQKIVDCDIKEVKNKQRATKIDDSLKDQIIKALMKESFGTEKRDNYLLIIEELNRANAAAVFGDVFQLLDRNNGESSYPIVTSEEARDYLANEFYGSNYDDCTPEQQKECKTMSIPSNMYIWATMNSADQGVEVLDTAFKRRWEFEYIGINDSSKDTDNKFKRYSIPVGKAENKKSVSWDKLRRAINKKLSENCYVKEDKLLGPYFISKERLENANKQEVEFVEAFKSKVLLYLYEDAAAGNLDGLFSCKHSRYSEVCEEFENDDVKIFGFDYNELQVDPEDTKDAFNQQA